MSCGGSFSCYGISVMNYIYQVENWVSLICGGLYSCADVGTISCLPSNIGINMIIDCSGELSCFGTTFADIENQTCGGDRSCFNSKITSVD